MDTEHELRDMHIEHLSKLLSVVQDVARQLADESHGRAYDQVRELNEIVHLARVRIDAIQAQAGQPVPLAMERRRSARASIGPLR